MNDSTNLRIIADNIKKLFSKSSNLDSRISDLETAAAKIPKDLSTTETNTGLKWIDGKDIYQIVLNGTFPVIETSTQVLISENFDADTIIERFEELLDTSGNQHCDQHYIIYNPSNKHLAISGVAANFSECAYALVIYYTKPSATSKSLDEPEEKKTKKTTKKG